MKVRRVPMTLTGLRPGGRASAWQRMGKTLTWSFTGDVLQKEPKRGDMQTGERGRLRYHRESFQMEALMLLFTCIAASCSNTKVAGLNQHKQYSPSVFFQPFGEPIPAEGLLPIQSGANQ